MLDGLAAARCLHRARGRPAARARSVPTIRPIQAGGPDRRVGGHRVLPAGRQPDDPRRGRDVPAGRHPRRHHHLAVDRRHDRRAARHLAAGARRARRRHRRRRTRRRRAAGDGLPRLGPRHQPAGHGEGQPPARSTCPWSAAGSSSAPATRSWPTTTAWSVVPAAAGRRGARGRRGRGRPTRTPSAAALAAGELGVDMYGLRALLADLGVDLRGPAADVTGPRHDDGIPVMVHARRHLQGRVLPRRRPAGERRPSATTCCCAVMGSPDPRQIDGIGGGHPLTSKVAVGPAFRRRRTIDVDYLFLQVHVDARAWSAPEQPCGNILAGVGPFAIERGLVADRRCGHAGTDPDGQHRGGRGRRTSPRRAGGCEYAGDTAICRGPGHGGPAGHRLPRHGRVGRAGAAADRQRRRQRRRRGGDAHRQRHAGRDRRRGRARRRRATRRRPSWRPTPTCGGGSSRCGWRRAGLMGLGDVARPRRYRRCASSRRRPRAAA